MYAVNSAVTVLQNRPYVKEQLQYCAAPDTKAALAHGVIWLGAHYWLDGCS